MLVYLDNSDLAWLERLARQEPSEFQSFAADWQQQGCELALSFHHAQETAQLADPLSIKARMEIIECLGVLRFAGTGAIGAMELEAEVQLLAKATDTTPSFGRIRNALFPVSSRAELENVVMSNQTRLKRHHDFLDSCTEASNTMAATMSEFHEELLKAGITPRKEIPPGFDWDTVWEVFESAWRATEGTVSAERSKLGQLLRPLHESAKREGSPRKGLQALLGMKGIAVVDDVEDDNLLRVASYFQSARDVAVALANHFAVNPHLFLVLVPELNPFECPGFRIQLAAERARRRTAKRQATSDLIDVEHVIFAPYVDMMFVDKRTADHLRRELGAGPDKLKPAEISMLRKGGSLEKVRAAIQNASVADN